jgi:hypothetical protein
LSPFEDEQTVREIAATMGYTVNAVSAMLEAFNTEMNRPGGEFHRVCAAMDAEDLNDLGLGWVMGALGSYREPSRRSTTASRKVLTGPMKKRSALPPPPGGAVRDSSVLAQFLCEFHQRAFVARYLTKAVIPKAHPCPSCGRESRLIRTAGG